MESKFVYEIKNKDVMTRKVAYFAYHLSKKLNKGPIVIARDASETSKIIHNQIAQGLITDDREIHTLDIAPTEAIVFCTTAGTYAGGVIVSSNFNTNDGSYLVYFFDENGRYIDLSDISYKNDIDLKASNKIFKEEYIHAFSSRIGRIMGESIRCKQLKLFIDFSSGSMPRVFQKTLKSACSFVKLIAQVNAVPDFDFSIHGSDPYDKKAEKILVDGVLNHNADIGIIFNTDGNLIRVCDENGNILSDEDLSLVVFHEVLNRKPGHSIITNVSLSKNIIEKIEEFGGEVIYEKKSTPEIMDIMSENDDFIIAYTKEGSFVFSDFFNASSPSLATCYILSYFAKQNKSISQSMFNLKEQD